MKTNNKLSAYILRGSTAALLFSCVIVTLCSAINLPGQPPKAPPSQDNAGFGASRSLSFAERVAYQSAIEDVYWRHRIWPNTNAGPKPSLDAVMSQAEIEKKVTDYLRDSQALEDYRQRPITAEQLQAEMERMASHTKQPDVLRELFEALENDPFVIAECLARPVVAERLGNSDPVAAGVSPAQPTRLPPQKLIAQVPVTMATVNSASYTLPVIASPSGGCIDDTWTSTTLTNAPAGRFDHTAVWTGSEMIVWGGSFGPLNTGGKYDPGTDSWTATNITNAPSGRHNHTAVWTGSEMIVWGGCADGNGGCTQVLSSGGRYNPVTNSWTATSTTNAPSARAAHTAVWTGSEMIVWGGGLDPSYVNTGGRYNPSTNSWTATSTTNAPTGRGFHTAVWTGSEMIVWGGFPYTNTGEGYDPVTDRWNNPTSTTNAPSARGYHTAVLTDSEMIVWGGYDGSNVLNSGGRYNLTTGSWTATSTTNAPTARYFHTAVGNGGEMTVWGGLPQPGTNTGGRYNPSTDSWTATSTTNAPDGRGLHTAVWTGSEMIVWGGNSSGSPLNTGGRYCAVAGGPTPTPTSSPSPTATATATATATPTATPSVTATATPGGRATPAPRPRPTPAPRP